MTDGPILYVGIDWGTESHRVCIVGKGLAIIVNQFDVSHSG